MAIKLYSANELRGHTVAATDGSAGRVNDLIVDSGVWTVHFVVARHSRWLRVYDVLVPRRFIDRLQDRRLHISVPRVELRPYVADSPTKPGEDGLGALLGGAETGSGSSGSGDVMLAENAAADLLPVKTVKGSPVKATDGAAGRIKDVIINSKTWHVAAFVVGTRGHLPGKKVLLPVQWVEGVGPGGAVKTNAGRDVIRGAPGLNTRRPVSSARFEEVIAYYSTSPGGA